MTMAARRIDPDVWTKERFLAWAETQAGDRSYEFDGVRPVAMAPATLGHNEIARNIREAVRRKLQAGSGSRPTDRGSRSKQWVGRFANRTRSSRARSRAGLPWP